jgi:hypothetical protein
MGIHGIDEASSLPFVESARTRRSRWATRRPGAGDQKETVMTRITQEGLEACMAFGMASLAVADVVELIADQLSDGPVLELLAELESAHQLLRDLFDDGDDAGVHTVALTILVLADRTTDAVQKNWNRSGR